MCNDVEWALLYFTEPYVQESLVMHLVQTGINHPFYQFL